jgi:hypothetical protein
MSHVCKYILLPRMNDRWPPNERGHGCFKVILESSCIVGVPPSLTTLKLPETHQVTTVYIAFISVIIETCFSISYTLLQ